VRFGLKAAPETQLRPTLVLQIYELQQLSFDDLDSSTADGIEEREKKISKRRKKNQQKEKT